MQPVLDTNNAVLHSDKPLLDSYDSAEECSLDHWVQLCKLVDECENAELEEHMEVMVSEV